MSVKNERDHRTFQMSNSLPQLRHIHYKNPQVPSHTQLRCKTPPINMLMIISSLQLLHTFNCNYSLWCSALNFIDFLFMIFIDFLYFTLQNNYNCIPLMIIQWVGSFCKSTQLHAHKLIWCHDVLLSVFFQLHCISILPSADKVKY